MSMERSYVLDKNTNIDALLKGLGVKEEKIAKFLGIKQNLDFKLDGKSLTIISSHGDTRNENKITLGEPSIYKLAVGAEIEVNLTLTGNVAKGSLKKGDATGTVQLDISPEALVETFVVGGVTATRSYKKA